jgi:hypothetical protein
MRSAATPLDDRCSSRAAACGRNGARPPLGRSTACVRSHVRAHSRLIGGGPRSDVVFPCRRAFERCEAVARSLRLGGVEQPKKCSVRRGDM